MNDEIAKLKADLRRTASKRRKEAAALLADAGINAGALIAAQLTGSLDLSAYRAMSGFLPIGSEVDPRPTLANARSAGLAVALPCVVAADAPLLFRQWQDGDPLVKETFGTQAPAPTAPEVSPDIMLVPMLAYDAAGYRLGYGGGFYDRTLAALRGRGLSVCAVGVALDAQEVAAVPRDQFDQPLDWIITEKRAIPLRP